MLDNKAIHAGELNVILNVILGVTRTKRHMTVHFHEIGSLEVEMPI